jgi:hypothetical protein
MLVAPVMAGVAIFGLLVSWGTIFHNGEASTIAENRTNPSSTYSNPVPDGNSSNGIALFYGSEMPATTYLEERVGGSEYTQREDNRTLVDN